MLNFIFILRQGLMSPQAGFQLAVELKMALSCSLLAYLLVSVREESQGHKLATTTPQPRTTFNFWSLSLPPPGWQACDIVSSFCRGGDQIRGFGHARQTIYQMSSTPSPNSPFKTLCLSIGVSKKWCHYASFQIWVLLVSQFSTWGNP